MLDIRYSAKFKRDYKLAIARGLDVKELEVVIEILRRGETLPAKYHDHPLKGNWAHHRDCHIHGDWLLIYKIDKTELILDLIRTGTHSDLFKK